MSLGFIQISRVNEDEGPVGNGFCTWIWNGDTPHVFSARINSNGHSNTCAWELDVDGDLLDTAVNNATISHSFEGQTLTATLIDNLDGGQSFKDGDRLSFQYNPIR